MYTTTMVCLRGPSAVGEKQTFLKGHLPSLVGLIQKIGQYIAQLTGQQDNKEGKKQSKDSLYYITRRGRVEEVLEDGISPDEGNKFTAFEEMKHGEPYKKAEVNLAIDRLEHWLDQSVPANKPFPMYSNCLLLYTCSEGAKRRAMGIESLSILEVDREYLGAKIVKGDTGSATKLFEEVISEVKEGVPNEERTKTKYSMGVTYWENAEPYSGDDDPEAEVLCPYKIPPEALSDVTEEIL